MFLLPIGFVASLGYPSLVLSPWFSPFSITHTRASFALQASPSINTYSSLPKLSQRHLSLFNRAIVFVFPIFPPNKLMSKNYSTQLLVFLSLLLLVSGGSSPPNKSY